MERQTKKNFREQIKTERAKLQDLVINIKKILELSESKMFENQRELDEIKLLYQNETKKFEQENEDFKKMKKNDNEKIQTQQNEINTMYV